MDPTRTQGTAAPGLRFDSTDERLANLYTLIDFDSDYANTYDAWVNAGPIE